MDLRRLLQTATRPIVRKGAGHWLRMALLLALGAYAGHLLSEGEWLTSLRYRLYARQLHLQAHTTMYPKRTAVVLVEDDDYWSDRFEARKPIRRDRLAELLDRLDEAGANTIVVDFDLRSPLPDRPGFDFPSYAAEDAMLVAAVDRLCKAGRHVVLPASVRFGKDEDHYEQLPSIYGASSRTLPCLHAGYLELPDDMRRLPGPLSLEDGGHLDSLSLAAVRIADPIAYAEIAREEDRPFRFSSFLSADDFAPREGRKFIFSTAEVRTADSAALHQQLADRIVFLGGHWHQYARGEGEYIDLLESPGGLLPGVMLHANYVEAMLDRTGTFTPVSDRTAEILETLLVIALGFIGVLEIGSVWKWVAFAGGLLLAILLTYVLLQNLGLFLDFAIPLLMIVVHTLVEEILCMRQHLKAGRHKLKEHSL